MLFGKLLPREGNFFDLFNQHAERIVEAAHAFSNMVANYSDVEKREGFNRDVDNAKRAADRITHEVNRMLHKTFITPIDREQIHSLINTMDDVADLIQDSAETMALYDVRHMTDEIVRLTDLSVKCCERLKDAVALISKFSEPATAEAALKTCEEIDRLESDQIATALELTLVFAGLVLLWRLALSPAARAQPPPAQLAPWDTPLSNFFLFLWLAICGGLVLPVVAQQAARGCSALCDAVVGNGDKDTVIG